MCPRKLDGGKRSRVEEWRGGLGVALRVAGPFGCRCPSIPPCSVSTPRSSNRACGFAAPGSPTGFFSRPTALPKDSTFTDLNSSFRDRRTLIGVARPHGQSPGSRSLPQRARSEVPSLRRHYPASTVSGRRRRARLPSRWPPSATQTERAGFPHSAFTKARYRRRRIEGIKAIKRTSPNSP
jgi:hypothetical protein